MPYQSNALETSFNQVNSLFSNSQFKIKTSSKLFPPLVGSFLPFLVFLPTFSFLLLQGASFLPPSLTKKSVSYRSKVKIWSNEFLHCKIQGDGCFFVVTGKKGVVEVTAVGTIHRGHDTSATYVVGITVSANGGDGLMQIPQELCINMFTFNQ